jgi:hypothetical protein
MKAKFLFLRKVVFIINENVIYALREEMFIWVLLGEGSSPFELY